LYLHTVEYTVLVLYSYSTSTVYSTVCKYKYSAVGYRSCVIPNAEFAVSVVGRDFGDETVSVRSLRIRGRVCQYEHAQNAHEYEAMSCSFLVRLRLCHASTSVPPPGPPQVSRHTHMYMRMQ
jgi:hypothetical protein